MLRELKRCNNVGNYEGLLFLAKILQDKELVNRQEIMNRASLEKKITLNSGGAIAFFQYLGYLELEGDKVIPLEKVQGMASLARAEFIAQIVKDCIKVLSYGGIFDTECTEYDVETGRLSIKCSAFPLTYAAIRNFLTYAGVLENRSDGGINVSVDYENEFSKLLRARREKFSLKQLLERQKKQNERGLGAEEFALAMEKKRLPQKARHIKRISDFDVSAGYDIVSFVNDKSPRFDKFIEVKCYLGTPHFFWSENEVDTAKIKGDKYYLCLVDYEKMKSDPEYSPEWIQNPYDVIFSNDQWLVDTASYKVQKT